MPRATTRNVRASARGNPSTTVRDVENIVVTTATSTMGRIHAPSVVAYRSTSCTENWVPWALKAVPDRCITPAPRITKANAMIPVPM